MKRIIVSVTNNLVRDQRVERVCLCLYRQGYKVLLVGRLWPSEPLQVRAYPCKRLKLLFSKGFLFYAEYNIRLFFYLLFKKTDILLSNDLDTLPANYLASKMKRSKLYFDSHEYFPETPEVYQRKFVKCVWQALEKMLIRGCDVYYTVSASLADIYKQKYGLNFAVVRNVPFRLNGYGIENNRKGEKIILYQGCVNVGRGLDLMLQALVRIPGAQLVVAGDGPELPKLKELAKSLGVSEKTIFTGNLLPEQLRVWTIKASVGISIEEPMGESYKGALPNKLFDYIQARVPVLVSDLPEMRRVVEHYQIGLVLEQRTALHLASTLKIILENEEKRNFWKRNLEEAAKELCWENEEKILLEVFSGNCRV